MKRLSFIIYSLLFIIALATAQTIDTRAEGQALTHYWSVGTCAGRANEGLRTSWVEQLQRVHDECGFQYLRMHGLFDDDMCVYDEDRKGNPIYNWQYIDEVYDRMLEIGVRPFVELSFFPEKIAREGTLRQMWYRNCVSFDAAKLPKWTALVQAFTQHVVDHYGLDEVRQWYFEVWNEPNLNMTPKAGFFEGTKSDYFALYKASAEAVKAVDSQLRVGGPATSNFIADNRHDGEVLDNKKSVFYSQEEINKQQWKGIWIEEFLAYCAQENLPVDFVSCHAYPTDYALDPVSGRGKDAVRYVHSLHDDLSWLRKTIAASRYPQAEIHITEWSTSPSSRDAMHDNLPPAAYIVKAMLDNHEIVNSKLSNCQMTVMYWTFTDIFEEKGGGMRPFHGGFGMLTFQGWAKPSFHAYRMLHALGDRVLHYEDPLCVTRDGKTGKVAALAFNYPEEYISRVPCSADVKQYMDASSKKVAFRLEHLPANATFVVETLDDTHGNAIRAYQQIGSPAAPTREQTVWMREQSDATLKELVKADASGTLTFERTLLPWTVMLIKQL